MELYLRSIVCLRGILFHYRVNCTFMLGSRELGRRRIWKYRGADKSLARPTSRYILFDGENILFDASLVIYIVLIFLQL